MSGITVSPIEQACKDKGMKMTGQRRIIAQVLSDAVDHPDVESVYRRAAEVDSGISIATVYRTVRLFEEANIITRHDFGEGRSRYEQTAEDHHDHIINTRTGEVLEFHNEEIEALQRVLVEELGLDLVGHRMELFCIPKESD